MTWRTGASAQRSEQVSGPGTTLRDVAIKDLWRRLISNGAPTTHEPVPDFSSIRRVALRFRAECAAHGPHEFAAALGMVPEVEDLRLIAYLAAHACVEDQRAIELAVEQGIYGLQEWLDREEARRA